MLCNLCTLEFYLLNWLEHAMLFWATGSSSFGRQPNYELHATCSPQHYNYPSCIINPNYTEPADYSWSKAYTLCSFEAHQPLCPTSDKGYWFCSGVVWQTTISNHTYATVHSCNAGNKSRTSRTTCFLLIEDIISANLEVSSLKSRNL